MSRLIDLTGKKFGQLTVISRGETIFATNNTKTTYVKWLCKCDCGKEKQYLGTQLKRGSVISCGHKRKEAFDDLTDRKFGKLTVISHGGVKRYDHGKTTLWKCICECGAERILPRASLIYGKTKSCGSKTCSSKYLTIEDGRSTRVIDLVGKRFGYLTVISKNNKQTDQKHIKWECRCDCGRITNVLGYHLRNGDTISCGWCHKSSIFEKEVGDYIAELIGESNIKRSVWFNYDGMPKGSRGYECDIFIPSFNIIIETNGLYHNHVAIAGSSEENKFYHMKKSKEFEKLGYRTIFLWSDDWKYRQYAVKNYLKSIFRSDLLPIFDARKCSIKVAKYSEISDILENFHLQGGRNSKYWYALEYKDKLVAVMGFGRTRGIKIDKGMIELTRYASIGRVRGGASKLIKYFQNHHNNDIVSYSDNDTYTGKMYEKVGFKFDGETPPGYSTIWNGKRKHRSYTMKSNLIRLSKSGKLKIPFNETMTEVSCLNINNIYRCWNSGNKRWILHHK